MSDDSVAERIAALEAEVAALRAERATLQALLESVPDYVLRITPDAVCEYANRVRPGVPRERVLGQSMFGFTAPADLPAMRAAIARVLATGEHASYEATGHDAEGRHTPYFGRLGPIVQDGRVVALSLVATDVTDVKTMTRTLAEQGQRLELASASIDIGYWRWVARTGAVTWDATACKHFGVPAAQGDTTFDGFLERVHPADREWLRSAATDSVAGGRYDGRQFRVITPDGELRWLMTAGRVELDDRGQPIGLLGCILDVTERRRLEEQLLQAQRLDAVGQLAAGVAHNFNNLLAALIPALDLTARRAPDTAPLLRELQGASRRAAEVVRQLTAFAGGGVRGPARPTDTAELARRVAALSRTVIDRAIMLEVSAPAEPTLVQADAGELEQVLVNLILNARDALDGAIAAGRPAQIRIEVAPIAGDRVRVRVVDTGAGMTEDVRRRAIEPFFTTKPPGRGTGLGLSSAYAMVTARGGELDIESMVGAGTTITITLPAAAPAPEVTAPTPAVPPGGGEQILLVDDDPTVRRVITTVLAEHGYRVREAGDPRVALDVFAGDPGAFAAVIVDHSMPGLSGQALLDRMLAIAPATRAISFSGHDVPMTGAAARLAKPVSVDELLAAVRRVLDQP